MKISVSVRHARLEDASDLARVHVTAWRAAYREMLPEQFLQSLDIADQTPKWKNNVAKTLEAGDVSHIMIAETNAGIQGFVSFGPGRSGIINRAPGLGSLGQVYSLYVAPGFLKQGIGQAMLRAAFDVLRNRRYTEVFLTALEANKDAHSFYEKQGGINAGVETTMQLGGANVPHRAYRWALTPGV